MTKRTLKKLYKAYINGDKLEGVNWNDWLRPFAFYIPEDEREKIHKEYFIKKHMMKTSTQELKAA